MGRKIPGKKHRGVKDPEKQRARRLAELESRTNAAPRNVDEQAVPKSLERVIRLKEEAARTGAGVTKRRRRRKNALICVGQQRGPDRPRAKPEKVTPVFRQRPGESGHDFMHRVSRDTHNFLKEVAFEKKYDVQVERDPGTGEIQGLTKRKRDGDDAEAPQAKHKNIGRKKRAAAATLTRHDKRKLKLRLKREKALENRDEFERLQDRVGFGEVAHEPPRLKIKSKKMDGDRKPKDLLLNSLLEGPREASSAAKVIGRSAKRKYLSEAERRRIETRQNEAIEAYRQLKSQRSANRSC
ncbi:PREDICTED: coiled-coil domain-containing protein 137 [Vollenhovia emeryi]|uniref:coiled-coil domain-containing protein 137 n=1 Tax=Vollenhovia emeryi TaxID=411798 RepID=UPI0005F39C03|nr:PREDICTED: coiled-coil domain-containing protein 137 [Vollenhovia emeryi]